MIDLQFVKPYFSPNFNYVQFNNINLDTKVPAIPSAAHDFRKQAVPCVSSRTHPNRSKKVEKKAMCDLDRVRPKNVRRK